MVHLIGHGALEDNDKAPFRVESGGGSELARITSSLRHDTAYKPHQVSVFRRYYVQRYYRVILRCYIKGTIIMLFNGTVRVLLLSFSHLFAALIESVVTGQGPITFGDFGDEEYPGKKHIPGTYCSYTVGQVHKQT